MSISGKVEWGSVGWEVGRHHPSVFLNLSIWLIDWHILSGIETAKATCLKCVMYLRNFIDIFILCLLDGVKLNQKRVGRRRNCGVRMRNESLWFQKYSHHYLVWCSLLCVSLIKCIKYYLFNNLCFMFFPTIF